MSTASLQLDSPPLAGAEAAIEPSAWRLLCDAMPLLLCHRGWLAAVVAVSATHAALEPMQGMVIKRVVDGLSHSDLGGVQTVVNYIPWYVVILLGIALLQFFEKSLKGVYDPLITFALQRKYLQRRPAENHAATISRLQYDCRDARKVLEVFVRDLPLIVVGIATLIGLQWTLAPEWLPALLAIVVPNVALTIWLGRPIRRSNHEMFVAVTEVARVASADRLPELEQSQRHLYGRFWRRESWMGFSEVMMQFTIWIGCLAVVLVAVKSPSAMGLSEVSAGALALFIANVNQLAKTLVNFGKAYNKYWSTEPALRRTLYM